MYGDEQKMSERLPKKRTKQKQKQNVLFVIMVIAIA
jgi:hypothetical protein